eukprot:scaffold17153_cov42-Phaeocystis_antarctica.AAC.2
MPQADEVVTLHDMSISLDDGTLTMAFTARLAEDGLPAMPLSSANLIAAHGDASGASAGSSFLSYHDTNRATLVVDLRAGARREISGSSPPPPSPPPPPHVVSSPLDSSAYELSRATTTVTIGSSSSSSPFWSAIPSSPSSYSVT